MYSFLAILFHSFIFSCENVKKLYVHFVIFIPFVRFIYRQFFHICMKSWPGSFAFLVVWFHAGD